MSPLVPVREGRCPMCGGSTRTAPCTLDQSGPPLLAVATECPRCEWRRVVPVTKEGEP